jgi:hypothetical protein
MHARCPCARMSVETCGWMCATSLLPTQGGYQLELQAMPTRSCIIGTAFAKVRYTCFYSRLSQSVERHKMEATLPGHNLRRWCHPLAPWVSHRRGAADQSMCHAATEQMRTPLHTQKPIRAPLPEYAGTNGKGVMMQGRTSVIWITCLLGCHQVCP